MASLTASWAYLLLANHSPDRFVSGPLWLSRDIARFAPFVIFKPDDTSVHKYMLNYI